MLRQRIVTALVLLGIVVAVMMAPTLWPSVQSFAFAGLVSVVCLLTGWEWLRLTFPRKTPRATNLAALAGVALCVAWFYVMFQIPWILFFFFITGTIVWIWLALLALVVAASVEPPARSLPLSLLAAFVLPAVWLSLIFLYTQQGAWYIVSLLALVWIADSAAYFVGRRWGRRKLAPQVSPGKSVEGALAGMVAAVVWVLATGQIPDTFAHTFGHALLNDWGWIGATFWTLVLVAAAIVGDLFESLVKRRAGVKDSSGLLPGHGGVWDRVDAILPVAPLALYLSLFG